MTRDTNPPSRPELREVEQARRPPRVEAPTPAAGVVPAPAPRRERPDRPTHLMLTNGATPREEVLLGVAGRLAGRAGAAVRVAHLYDSPPAGELEEIRRLAPAEAGGPVGDICAGLFLAARTLAGRTGLPVAPELLIGPGDPTLTGYVRAHEFDLVTAAAGNTWLSLWRGGPWLEVARQRPVLVVGPGVSPAWGADPGPAGGVLVVLDGTAAAEEVLAPAAALCRLLGERLTLLRVGPPGADESTAARCHQYLLGVGRLVRRHVPAVRTVVTAGRPADAVLGVQRATGAVVALAAPTRSRLAARTPGRLGVRVLRGSTAPVLFYRPTL